MPKIKRLPSGRPIPHQSANALDTVALISGVNRGSVLKIFAALEMLAGHLALPVDQLVRVIDAPTEAPRFDGTDEQRLDATQRLAVYAASDPRYVSLDYILHHVARMDTRTDVAGA